MMVTVNKKSAWPIEIHIGDGVRCVTREQATELQSNLGRALEDLRIASLRHWCCWATEPGQHVLYCENFGGTNGQD